jgi:hypothetical protein
MCGRRRAASERWDTDVMTGHDRREMFQRLPFPFDGDEFPAALGAVIQRTVLDGSEPAREVIHTPDGSWLVGDGISDPIRRAHPWPRISGTRLSAIALFDPSRACRQGTSPNGKALATSGRSSSLRGGTTASGNSRELAQC